MAFHMSPIAVGGPRSLSSLEQDAVNLVFKGSIDLSKISLTVVESLEVEIELDEREGIDIDEEIGNQLRPLPTTQPPGIINLIERQLHIEQRLPPEWPSQIETPQRTAIKLQLPSTYDGDGKIRISQSAFPYTRAVKINSHSTRAGTPIFEPANMHYLSTLIHECTHHWQEEYGRHGPPVSHVNAPDQLDNSRFVFEQLQKRDVPDLSPEQHASAAQVYFLIAWQLRYLVEGSLVNLTSRSENPEFDVGPVHLYPDIDKYAISKNADCPRILTYENARRLKESHFSWLIIELRHGWKAVCEGKESFPKAIAD